MSQAGANRGGSNSALPGMTGPRTWTSAFGRACGVLLDAIVRYLPSPQEEGPFKATDKGGKEVEVAADGGQLLVRVFKTAADPFVGGGTTAVACWQR